MAKPKYQYFNGVRFIRDDKTGYYGGFADGRKIRMHRYVWEYYNGEIPKGYHIHHIDRDKSNNDISNLQLIAESEHCKLHSKQNVEENYDSMKENLDNIRHLASEWHGSEAGHEWHKKHYENMKDKLCVRVDMTCEYCGERFEGLLNHSRFCSNKCKSAWRRREGLDNETRICEYCGKEFVTNRYSKIKNCSRKCSQASRRSKQN